MTKDTYSVREAAYVLDVSVTQVHRMIESAELTAFTQGESALQVECASLADACAKRAKPMPAQYAVVIELSDFILQADVSDEMAAFIARTIQEAVADADLADNSIIHELKFGVKLLADVAIRGRSIAFD